MKCCGKFGGNASMMDKYSEQIAMSSGAAERNNDQHTHGFQPQPTPICMPMHSESVICPSPLSRNLTFAFGIERFTQRFIPVGPGVSSKKNAIVAPVCGQRAHSSCKSVGAKKNNKCTQI